MSRDRFVRSEFVFVKTWNVWFWFRKHLCLQLHLVKFNTVPPLHLIIPGPPQHNLQMAWLNVRLIDGASNNREIAILVRGRLMNRCALLLVHMSQSSMIRMDSSYALTLTGRLYHDTARCQLVSKDTAFLHVVEIVRCLWSIAIAISIFSSCTKSQARRKKQLDVNSSFLHMVLRKPGLRIVGASKYLFQKDESSIVLPADKICCRILIC